jgi:hypothetical protein
MIDKTKIKTPDDTLRELRARHDKAMKRLKTIDRLLTAAIWLGSIWVVGSLLTMIVRLLG